MNVVAMLYFAHIWSRCELCSYISPTWHYIDAQLLSTWDTSHAHNTLGLLQVSQLPHIIGIPTDLHGVIFDIVVTRRSPEVRSIKVARPLVKPNHLSLV